MHYSIDKITALIGARRFGTAEADIDWLLTDSRSLVFPETTLSLRCVRALTADTSTFPTFIVAACAIS